MYYHVLLGAALLICCAGKSLVHALPETVQAFVGGDVVLPCSFHVSANDDLPSVEWSKEGLQPNVIYLFRHGCETYEMKNPAFEFRTSLITMELKNRNFSLRISNVKLSDAGTYRCMRLTGNAPTDFAEVKLVVGAVSQPELSFTSVESGGVALQCEAICWLPEPEITFLDHEGNHLPADEPKKDQDVSGCYTVKRRLTLQGAARRVTCRVHQPKTNQTRTKETLIPVDCMRSCSLNVGVAVVGAISLLLNLCGLAVLLWRRCSRSDGYKFPVSRKSSNHSPLDGSENQSLLKTVSVDGGVNMENSPVEKFPGEVADLYPMPLEPIHSNTQLISPHGKTRWNNPPKHIPRGRIFSDPNVLSGSSSASSSKKTVSFDSNFRRPSSAQRGPNVPKLKRRHSSVLPHLISDRFHRSPELPEETLTSI
ncbi:butyrophilin subfamily 1 member A1-like [Notolabrus celidotus]|uniref:butyrophilin subfamily 1 member A1-like n=1 Tax=Notolabrus celidotus TaxID=1203425 RepID=UPI001490670A|nr:butyrophilin subfamily 1 member A1-like [Notolabrus celidotus]